MYLLIILWCINYFTTSLCGEIQSYGNGGGVGGEGYDRANGYNSVNSIEVNANNGGYNHAGGVSAGADALKLISNIGYRTTAAASSGYGIAANTGYSNGGGLQYSGGAVDNAYGGNGGAYIVSPYAGNGLSYSGASYGGISGGGYSGSGYGGSGYGGSYSGAQYGPIPAAIQTTRTYEIRNVNLHSEPPQMQTVVVEPNELPITILFKSASSRLKVSQQHYGSPGSEERTQSEDEPHKLYHKVSKPVIQEVHEIITPYRRIIQEIQPVLEEIQTIVAKGEKRYGGEGRYGAEGGYGGKGGYGGVGVAYGVVGGGYGGGKVVEELVDSGYGGRISGGYGVSSGGGVGYGGNDIGLGVLAYDVSGGGGEAVSAKSYKS